MAQIFDDQRIRKRCAIITDLDAAISDTTENATDDEDTKKYKTKMARSADTGIDRAVRLESEY